MLKYTRKRISEEVIEIMYTKLFALPLPSDARGFNYETQKIAPNITRDKLDIAEVTMDLEDAFGVNFENSQIGDDQLETIGDTINFIIAKLKT